mmetsp:Transcript_14139/g.39407  ORF Transcript_14139/g.39407 Transcript_14139/m.39407 type:complete len:259 (+) Transcript_14139:1424-2200(+)
MVGPRVLLHSGAGSFGCPRWYGLVVLAARRRPARRDLANRVRRGGVWAAERVLDGACRRAALRGAPAPHAGAGGRSCRDHAPEDVPGDHVVEEPGGLGLNSSSRPSDHPPCAAFAHLCRPRLGAGLPGLPQTRLAAMSALQAGAASSLGQAQRVRQQDTPWLWRHRWLRCRFVCDRHSPLPRSPPGGVRILPWTSCGRCSQWTALPRRSGLRGRLRWTHRANSSGTGPRLHRLRTSPRLAKSRCASSSPRRGTGPPRP